MAKKSQERRKTVVFIVEGNSDKKALEKIFQKIYKHKNIVFKFTDGDITSHEDIDEHNVCEKIYEKVYSYMKDKKLTKGDIWQIVHIFDMDGAYVPEMAVLEGITDKFIYSPTEIKCKNRQRILKRNEKKRNTMNFLLTVHDIKGIAYTGFYMSCNLDHALYNEQNLEDEQKGDYADAFYTEFIGREELFIDFLREEVSNGTPDSFTASWRYIKEGLHSLERHSNLHIYFQQNPI